MTTSNSSSVPIVTEQVLKKVRRAVKLNHYFNISIPIDLLKYVINLTGCSKDFLAKYVLKEQLPFALESMFFEKFSEEDAKLVVKYLKRFGCYSSNQVILAESGNNEIFCVLLDYINSEHEHKLRQEAELSFVKQKDSAFLCDFLLTANLRLHSTTVSLLLERQDVNLLKTLLSIFKNENRNFPSDQEWFILQSSNTELIEAYIEETKLNFSNLIKLITEDNVAILQKYFSKHCISRKDLQEKLVCQGNKKLLASYVILHPLCDEVLMLLIQKDYRDILKLHYLKHGLSERVLNYLIGVNYFKKYVNLD